MGAQEGLKWKEFVGNLIFLPFYLFQHCEVGTYVTATALSEIVCHHAI